MNRPRRTRKAARPRSTKPTDWVHFLEPLVPEIEAALEILRRLRWAVELADRGLMEAPSPFPGCHNLYTPSLSTGLVESVLTPEEMVATLKPLELRQLRDEWEAEVREWGQGIWERRDETLRLRNRRHGYLEQIENLRGGADGFGDPNMTVAAAARLENQLRAEPGKEFTLKTGVSVWRGYAITDPFGNPLPLDEEKRLLEEMEDELAEQPKDERALRRIVKGEDKKSRGGVHDIDPRLLRPKK